VTATPQEVFRDRLAAVADFARRTNKATVLAIQQFPTPDSSPVLFPTVRESIANILAFAELGAVADLAWVLDAAGTDRFNWIAIDCDHKLPESAAIVAAVRARIAAERLLYYSDNQVWFDSGFDIVQRVERGVSGKRVMVCGSGPLADCFLGALRRIGADVVEGGAAAPDRPAPEIVLGAAQKRATIDEALIDRLPGNAAVYDIGIGNLTAAASDRARARGLRLYRLDNRAGVSSAIVRLLETDFMVGKLMGHLQVKGVDIVAGGLLAQPGAIVVDDIRNPAVIFGVADGHGRFRASLEPADERNVAFVRSLLRAGSRTT
jgi:hypothetical protein